MSLIPHTFWLIHLMRSCFMLGRMSQDNYNFGKFLVLLMQPLAFTCLLGYQVTSGQLWIVKFIPGIRIFLHMHLKWLLVIASHRTSQLYIKIHTYIISVCIVAFNRWNEERHILYQLFRKLKEDEELKTIQLVVVHISSYAEDIRCVGSPPTWPRTHLCTHYKKNVAICTPDHLQMWREWSDHNAYSLFIWPDHPEEGNIQEVNINIIVPKKSNSFYIPLWLQWKSYCIMVTLCSKGFFCPTLTQNILSSVFFHAKCNFIYCLFCSWSVEDRQTSESGHMPIITNIWWITDHSIALA